MPRKTKPCDNCRKHHLKCDNNKPKCSRCQRTGRDCTRQETKFRYHQNSTIQRDSKPQSLQYIDETSKYTGSHEEKNTPQNPTPGTVEVQNQFSQRAAQVHPPIENSSWQSKIQTKPEPIFLPLPQRETSELTCEVNIGEAFLLRYFVEELASWFDICDPGRHFGLVVPQRARFCSPLFNAVLSASARHFTTLPDHRQKEQTVKLGLREDLIISEAAVLDYHNRCIAHLRLLANEPDAIMDENLLAAAVVLRFYEELDAPFIYLPTGAATRGLQVFIEAQANLALESSGLRHAAFWVGFRQEFHMAFSQQRTFRLSLDVCDSYLTWDIAPDNILVNRLLIIAAHVIQFCYDDQSQSTYSRYEELVSLYHRWVEERPPSFFPVYSDNPDRENGQIFPQKWYLDDCHIVAEQSVGLINILLTAYDPKIARVGPGQRRAMESIDAKLKSTVLDICGIAISNRQEPTALLTASIAIAICGDRFSDRAEQQALMDIVVNTIRDNNYWPSTALGAKLQKAWNWDS